MYVCTCAQHTACDTPQTPCRRALRARTPPPYTQEDPFNAIIAGAATGGFLQLRAGLRPAFRSAVMGGVILVRLCD